MKNYKRLDKVVSQMVQRDQELEGLRDGFVEKDEKLFIRASVLARFLGYKSVGNFESCIQKAHFTASNSNKSIKDHFVDATLFDGEQDTWLTPWAAWATVLEADSRKRRVAMAKNYFATLANERGKSDEARLKERQAAKQNHKRLSGAAAQAGIDTTQQAEFHHRGYEGMYGMGVRDVEQHKGLTQGENLIDHADYTELAANNLRMSMTTDKLVKESISSAERAKKTHYNTGKIVRKAVQDGTGHSPEDLPLAPKSIDELTETKAQELKPLQSKRLED